MWTCDWQTFVVSHIMVGSGHVRGVHYVSTCVYMRVAAARLVALLFRLLTGLLQPRLTEVTPPPLPRNLLWRGASSCP